MKSVISTTYDDKYLYFLPIVTFCWNRLGVDVICFLPQMAKNENERRKYLLAIEYCKPNGKSIQTYMFDAPEHKEATYAQCARLYGACLDLPEDEVLITGDIDMAVFNTDFIVKSEDDFFDIYGADLVSKGQLPMCYAVGTVKTWRRFFTKDRTYQKCLDSELEELEAEHFRGNFWCRDQELLAKGVGDLFFAHNRAREGTQFATKRYDRDDSYIFDRLSPDTIDFHMNRPGYEDKNFEIILTILKYHYPNEDFTWLINYTEQYKALL